MKAPDIKLLSTKPAKEASSGNVERFHLPVLDELLDLGERRAGKLMYVKNTMNPN